MPVRHPFLLLLSLLIPVLQARGAEKAPVFFAHADGGTRITIEVPATVSYRIDNRSEAEQRVRVVLSDLPGGVRFAGSAFPRSPLRTMRLADAGRNRSEIELQTDQPVNVSDRREEDPPRLVIELRPVSAQQPPTVPAAAATTIQPVRETASAPTRPAPPRVVQTSSGPGGQRRLIVVIDPGHGGHHWGGVGRIGDRQVTEKEIVLRIAFEIEKLFKADARYEVRLTRRDDRFISLIDRTKIAEGFEGDLFVSLHTNAVAGDASRRARARGLEFWTWTPDGSRTAAGKALEDLENDDGSVSNAKPLLNQMMTDALLAQSLESRRLAAAMERAFLREPYFRSNYRGIESARFKVLENYSMPSVLIEYGFITHPEEVRRLADPQFQVMAARRTFEGLVGYLQMIEAEQERALRVAQRTN